MKIIKRLSIPILLTIIYLSYRGSITILEFLSMWWVILLIIIFIIFNILYLKGKKKENDLIWTYRALEFSYFKEYPDTLPIERNLFITAGWFSERPNRKKTNFITFHEIEKLADMAINEKITKGQKVNLIDNLERIDAFVYYTLLIISLKKLKASSKYSKINKTQLDTYINTKLNKDYFFKKITSNFTGPLMMGHSTMIQIFADKYPNWHKLEYDHNFDF